MKLAIIYDKDDYKLNGISYSANYKNMFDALIKKFDEVQHINDNCSAQDIEADVVIFFDVHSCHDIKIDGLKSHKAVKYEYFNDPHQPEQEGLYPNGKKFHKLNGKQRAGRAIERGINYIICPSEWGYDKFIAPHLGSDDEKMFLWFPVAPKKPTFQICEWLSRRRPQVIANGHLWQGTNGFKPYEFRNWAYRRPEVTFIPHNVQDKRVPVRDQYMAMLSLFAGGLALCDYYAVAKYLEIPLTGGLCFMQKLTESERMGFKNWESCIYVNKDNFDILVNEFKRNISAFQPIAENGRKTALNWTAEKFADFIYSHSEGQC